MPLFVVKLANIPGSSNLPRLSGVPSPPYRDPAVAGLWRDNTSAFEAEDSRFDPWPGSRIVLSPFVIC